ncbi:MAG TPA: GNAT family N-acetyltransferase [Steroidobacteraceae bacterium]|nr:GNAT family N-acetyltransferase [Steroidobacteraceae bacterium]
MTDAGTLERERGTAALTLRRWSREEWLAREADWNALLARAASDSLFLSWEWQTSWWRHFGDGLGQEPQILAFSRGAELVGLAPLYRRRVVRGGFLPARSVQVIGLSWREPGPLISEYLDVIAPAADLAAVREACLCSLLADPDWTEFVIGLTASGPQWRAALTQVAAREGSYLRELDRSITYQADLRAGFAAYLSGLHQSTRRSLWNLRRRLAVGGEVRIEQLTGADIEGGFEDLNRLHRLRWRKPAFAGRRLQFHLELARRLDARGELALSRLRVGGQTVSMLYDIRKPDRQYNIKMAFDPRLSGRISLGLLHLGYAMEGAADRGVAVYDFLAGPGRSSDFKRLLSQERHELSCVQILRGPVLASLYRWRDRVRQRAPRPSGSAP